MKYRIRVDGIERRVPKNHALPPSFMDFTELCRSHHQGDLGWFSIESCDPTPLFGADIREEIVPFFRLPDGGFVAFWFGSHVSPPVVWLGSEGEQKLVGLDWDDFIQRLARGKTCVPDLDDRELNDLPYLTSKSRGRLRSLAGKRAAFDRWRKKRAPKGEIIDPKRSERIRRGLVRVLRKHKHIDNLIGTTLVVDLTDKTYSVKWYDGGLKPYPAATELKETLSDLREALGRSLKKSELSIWTNGSVFFEENTILGSEMIRKKVEKLIEGG